MDKIKLTQEQEILVNAISAKIQEQMSHECAFDVKQRKVLHEFIDAVEAEEANHETHIIVFRIGNGLRQGMKRLVTVVTWGIILGIAWALFAFVIKPFGIR